uniref:myb-related transcription factor, partner of profilin-like n=1 Tax=Pristiophorus japonicus TaxID=55135 RepID=UPI00398E9B07
MQGEEMEAKRELGGRRRAMSFSEEAQESLVHEVEARWEQLTWDGHGESASIVYQRIWQEIAEAVSFAAPVRRGANQCRKRWNDIVGSARKKLASNRAELCKMGGGLLKMVELSDLEECAAALMGALDRTATRVGAEPVLVEVAQEEPLAPNGPPREDLAKEETVEETVEEEATPQTFVMVVVEVEVGI